MASSAVGGDGGTCSNDEAVCCTTAPDIPHSSTHLTPASSMSLPPSLPRTLELRARNSPPSPSAPHFVIGVDEAGRGPLAGPVVAAAFVILPPNSTAPPSPLQRGVADSKIIGENDRELLFGAICQCALDGRVAFETAEVDHQRIDEINILQATFEAMSTAALALVAKVRGGDGGGRAKATFTVLIDGNKVCVFVCVFAIASWSLTLLPSAGSTCTCVLSPFVYALHASPR